MLKEEAQSSILCLRNAEAPLACTAAVSKGKECVRGQQVTADCHSKRKGSVCGAGAALKAH